MNQKPGLRNLFDWRRNPAGCTGRGLIFALSAILLIPALLFLGAQKLVGSWRGPAAEGVIVVGPAETDPEKWRALLQELSDLALADEELRAHIDPEKVQRRWLGEPPATDEDIEAAERRLGVALPPSYKAFLKVSNGWTYPNSFVVKLAGTSEIGWTRDVDPQLISRWREGTRNAEEQFGPAPPRPEDHLPNTLMIHVPDERDDAAHFMLNPKSTTGDEMEAWFFSNWNPGAQAQPSFWHLMVNVRDSMRLINADRR